MRGIKKMSIAKIWEYIPVQEVNNKLRQDMCELDISFGGFEDNYFIIADKVPNDYTIIDFGCNMAPQSYLFKNHVAYVGIDTCRLDRFSTDNTIHYTMTIQEFFKKEFDKYRDKNIYAICNFVPDDEARELVFNNCENCLVYYPEEIRVKGFNKYRIEEAVLNAEEERSFG